VDRSQSEAKSLKETHKASLGELLIGARQRRGLSREAVVAETHIPAHYVQMLEDDDYRRICDQLYLLPFLRKYSSFLDIDQDETAMRLLQEVQRIENCPSAVRMDEPVEDVSRARRRNWIRPIMFSGLIAIIIGAYIAQPRHDTEATPAPKPMAADSASSSVATGTINMLPTSGSLSDSTASPRAAWQSRTAPEDDVQSVSRAVVPPIAIQNRSRSLPQQQAPNVRHIPNR
jgi:cytoskeletal protein RodZ